MKIRIQLVCLLFLLASATLQARTHRVAVGGLSAESNSFYPARSEMRGREITSRSEWLRESARGSSITSGLIESAPGLGLELYPTVSAGASFLGQVSDESFNRHLEQLVQKLKTAEPKFEGVFLVLHGAMVVESYPHGDAEVVRRVRHAMGPDFPIVVTHDFHANVAPELVRDSTVLITYKEHPHMDRKERGMQAAALMARILAGEVKPVQAIEKPPLLVNLINQNTFTGPMKPIVAESRRLERENPKVLAVSVPGGYQWADVPQMGPSVIVVTDGDPALAKAEAKRLSDMVMALRDKLPFESPDTETAVRMAMESDTHPVVIMDTGDNIGGGSAGDSTFLLAEFLRHKALGWAFSIYDAEAVQEAARLGAGGRFHFPVGGKTDRLHGEPVRITGHVRSLRQSQYDGGRLSAVIEVEGSTRDRQNLLLITSRPSGARSVDELTSNGIDPKRQTILVSKGVVAPYATFQHVAARFILANTPGPTDVNPARFRFERLRRPFYGIEP